jgi:cytochrome c556
MARNTQKHLSPWARHIILGLFLFSSAAYAGEPTTLQTIMQGLRDNLVEISDGLLTDDFELVEQGATAIANHPRIPPGQVQLVAKELGQEMPAFKQFDTRVHNLAVQISAAARNGDRAATISKFQDLVDGCFACHASYKHRVAGVLRNAN